MRAELAHGDSGSGTQAELIESLRRTALATTLRERRLQLRYRVGAGVGDQLLGFRVGIDVQFARRRASSR